MERGLSETSRSIFAARRPSLHTAALRSIKSSGYSAVAVRRISAYKLLTKMKPLDFSHELNRLMTRIGASAHCGRCSSNARKAGRVGARPAAGDEFAETRA